VLREIHPIEQRKHPELLGVRIDDMGVPARQQREGPAAPITLIACQRRLSTSTG